MASSGDVAVRNGSHGINGAHGIKGAHGYSREEIIEVMDELMGMFTQSPVQTGAALGPVQVVDNGIKEKIPPRRSRQKEPGW